MFLLCLCMQVQNEYAQFQQAIAAMPPPQPQPAFIPGMPQPSKLATEPHLPIATGTSGATRQPWCSYRKPVLRVVFLESIYYAMKETNEKTRSWTHCVEIVFSLTDL